MRLLWIGKTGDANAWYHIYPFVKSDLVDEVVIVRRDVSQRAITDEKVRWSTFGRSGGISELYRFISAGHRELSRSRFDVIVTFNIYPWGALAWMLGKWHRVPIWLGLIGTDFNTHVKTGVFKNLFRWILKTSDIASVTGGRMLSEYHSIVKIKGVVIYPHVLPDDIRSESRVRNRFGLVSISALTENKRTLDIIKAVELLKDRFPDIRLDVLGNGPLELELQKYVEQHRLGEFIRFQGYVSVVNPFLQSASFFIQASMKEGLSLSLIEAIGSGVVPIVTHAGSEDDLIREGENGLFIPFKNPEALAEVLAVSFSDEQYSILADGVCATRNILDTQHAVQVVNQALSKIIAN